jgi:hypothetical protein
VFWIIVLLQDPCSVQLQLLDRWPHILLKNSQVRFGIYSWLNDGKLARPSVSKAAINHNSTASMLYGWYEVLLFKGSVLFLPKMPSVQSTLFQ